MRSLLEVEGHEVIEARDGNEGPALQRQAPAELVITDILMPEKDGVEVLMALRQEYPTLKVIAMSGGGRFKQTEALEIAEPLGAFTTVHEPFNLDVMLDVVRMALAA